MKKHKCHTDAPTLYALRAKRKANFPTIECDPERLASLTVFYLEKLADARRFKDQSAESAAQRKLTALGVVPPEGGRRCG